MMVKYCVIQKFFLFFYYYATSSETKREQNISGLSIVIAKRYKPNNRAYAG